MKNYFIGFSAVLFAAAVILSGCKNPSANTGTGGNKGGNTPSSGDTNAINTPTRIGDAAGWSLAALGDNHGVALNAGNGVFTWGANTKGQLGGDEKTRIVQVGADKGWSTAAAGEGFSLGVKNNELFTWGKNDNGQLASGSTSTAPNGVPTSRGTGWTKVSAGDEHALALKSGGTGSTNVQLFAWGAKGAGRLGIGSLTVFQESESQATPGRESTNSNDWAEISAGSVHGMGLRNGNEAAGFELWAWGFNASGHVGNSTSDKQFSPVRINTPGAANTKWKTIAGGTEHSLAIRSDGSLWAWGSYEYGRLTTDWGGSFAPRSGNRTTPFRIGTDTDWKAVSAGTNHSLALKGDGTLWAWGLNDSGQLGYTAADTLRTLSGVTFRGRKTPGQVGTDSDWDKIYAGFDHSLAIRTDGTLWAWGGNSSGQLGFGTPLDGTGELTSQTTPRQAGRSANWADISTAAPDGDNGGTKPVSHTLAIDTEGRLYSWGSSGSRELGRGAASGYLRPGEITLE